MTIHLDSQATLEEAIRLMAHHQLGIDAQPEEVESIAAWLRSLTGAIPTDYIARPKLPGEP